MKISHVSALYYPYVGGIELAVQHIAEEQADLGNEIYVVTSNYFSKGSKVERLNHVTIFRVKSLNVGIPPLIIPREVPEAILRKVDVIHGWGIVYYFVYKLMKYGKTVLKKPIVAYFIGVDYLEKHYNPVNRLFGYRYQKTITRRLADLVDLVIVTNNHERRILKERYGVDSIVLPHGVSEQYLQIPNMANYFRNKYEVHGKIIAYIGRIHQTKGLDLLIKSFAEVAKRESDVTLVIAGKGDVGYVKKCMKLIKTLGLENRVRYLGYISEEDKIGLIDSSEFIVIPSRHSGESCPLVIEEVKARGKPLVVTNYGALPYMIIDSIEGIVVNADTQNLARGLYYALSNKASFRILSKPLTWKEIANRLLRLYQSIIK